jgi:hypothetical protein
MFPSNDNPAEIGFANHSCPYGNTATISLIRTFFKLDIIQTVAEVQEDDYSAIGAS